MNLYDLLEIYGFGEEDLKEISTLKPYFSEEFKGKLAVKVRDFVFEKLPYSKKLLERMGAENAFSGTIEKFFDTLFVPERLKIYVNTVARTHSRIDSPLQEFLKDFAVFFKEIVECEDVPEERKKTFKKLIFLIFAISLYLTFSYLKDLTLKGEKDPVTKLPAKKYLVSDFSRLVGAFDVLVFIDISGFKEINLYYGYRAGNSVLAFMASLLESEFGEKAFITRVQNDEFIALIKGSPEKAVDVLKKMKENLRKEFVSIPVKSKVEEISLDFSSMVVSTQLCRGMDFELLLWILHNSFRKEECSVTGVKVLNRSDVEKWRSNRETVLNVMDALNSRKIKIAFQDVVNIRTGSAVFREALARVVSPDGEILPAGRFISLISETGIEVKLDRVVSEKVFYLMSKGYVKGRVSLNLSCSFIRNHFESFVETIKRYGISPNSIIIELTERENFLETAGIADKLNSLREMGISIFIDDFGVKFANYNLLKDLPITGLKIDGSIVKNLKVDYLDRAFMSCIFEIARLKNMEVVAEYVESEDIKAALQDILYSSKLETLYAQGFAFSSPVILDEV